MKSATWLRRADFALVVLLAAVALRLLHPGLNRPFWLDEEMIAMNLRARDMLELTGSLDNAQAAPLGWLWLERIVLVLLGTDEWALRLPPFLFGMGTLVVAYWFGRKWLDQVAAVALVALFGFGFGMLTYTSELKHYSSDIFWVMLLIALARWVLDQPGSGKRQWVWWAAACAGSWLSLGAVLATPAMAIVLIGHLVWRSGPRLSLAAARSLAKAGLPGLVWVASFGLHYLLSLRATAKSEYLTEFWDGLGYPPSESGAPQVLLWLVEQAGTLLQTTFYLDVGQPGKLLSIVVGAVFAGLMLLGLALTMRRRPAFGLILCAPLVAAALLALLRVSPLYGRLAFWLVPPVFVAIAEALNNKQPRGRPWQWVVYAAFLPLLVPFANSVKTISRPMTFDDRAAVAWMLSRHEPGDVTLFIGSAARAGQWYDPERRLTPAHMVVSLPAGQDCDPAQLHDTVSTYRRVIAYAGVRLAPYKYTYQVLEAQLASIGAITETRWFGSEGIVWVVDLSGPVAQAVSQASRECIRVY